MSNLQVLMGPMLAAAIGGFLSVCIIELMRGRRGVQAGGITIMSYGPVARFVAAGSLAFPVLCLIGAWYNNGLLITSVLCVLSLILGYYAVLATYLSFGVQMAFNKQAVYYKSPIRGTHIISWKAIERIGYSDLVQTHYFKATNGQMYWVSRSMNGFDEFMSQANAK